MHLARVHKALWPLIVGLTLLQLGLAPYVEAARLRMRAAQGQALPQAAALNARSA